jgi:hypothetical protein
MIPRSGCQRGIAGISASQSSSNQQAEPVQDRKAAAWCSFAGVLGVFGAALLAAYFAETPRRPILLAAGIVCLAVALVIPGIYVVGSYKRPPIDRQHEGQLRGWLQAAQGSLESGDVVTVADPPAEYGEHANEWFRAHFPEVANELVPWNEARRRTISAAQALTKRVEQAAAAEPFTAGSYQPGAISRGVLALIYQRVQDGTLDQDLEVSLPGPGETRPPLTFMTLPPVFGILFSGDYECAIHFHQHPEKGQRERVFEPLRQLMVDSQRWTESKEVQAAHQAITTFNRQPALLAIKAALAPIHLSYQPKCSECKRLGS